MVGPHLCGIATFRGTNVRTHKHAHTPIRIDQTKLEAMFMFAYANGKGCDEVSYVLPLCLCQRNLQTSFRQRAMGRTRPCLRLPVTLSTAQPKLAKLWK